MRLPFTHEQFLDLFAHYNDTLWPAVVLLWLVTVATVASVFQRRRRSSRAAALMLAIHWLWSGAVYHIVFFRRINHAALAFGVLFIFQAVLLFWRGVFRSHLHFDAGNAWHFLGWGLVLYSLVYPGVGVAFGMSYPRIPFYAVPCPTVLLTAGLLLLAPRSELRWLVWVPLVWALVGGSAAVLLQVRADFALLLAAVLLLARIAGLRFRRSPAALSAVR